MIDSSSNHAVASVKAGRLLGAERNGFQITPLVLGAKRVVERVVLNALETRRCRRSFAMCDATESGLLGPLGDGHRLEDKTIHPWSEKIEDEDDCENENEPVK